MVKFSQREAVLLLATFFTALYAGSLIIAKPKFELIGELREKQTAMKLEIERDKRLVSRRDGLSKKFEELSQLLPPAAEDDMGVYWQKVLEQLARKNDITIINSKASQEKKLGEVYELPIECKTWEGNLDGITHFLFDLQAEGAMLDIRKLVIRSKDNYGLRGSFTLNCAYTRVPANKGEALKEGDGETK